MADKLTKQALAEQRKCLKVRLLRERGVPARRIGDSIICRPACIWCKNTIWVNSDVVMHEWLIKRANLPVNLQHLIMHEYNCVLAHYNCHEQHGQTREFKMRCARAQYKRYSREEIVAWVESLGLRQHVEVPDVGDL